MAELEQEMSLEDLRAVQYELQRLQQSPGWHRIEQYASDQVKRRLAEIILNGEEFGGKVDYARGECAGIQLFSRIPSIELERLAAEIEHAVKLVEQKEAGNEHDVDEDLNGQPLAP